MQGKSLWSIIPLLSSLIEVQKTQGWVILQPTGTRDRKVKRTTEILSRVAIVFVLCQLELMLETASLGVSGRYFVRVPLI